MIDTRPDSPNDAVGWRIRASNPNGFRHNREGADAWATVLAVVTTAQRAGTIAESKREAYVVRFDDGETDLWVVDDPSDPYLWAPGLRPEDPPRRFVILTIDSERFEYRSRHLVIDLARADGGAALAAECDNRFGAEVVAAALELHPAESLPIDDTPF